MEFQLFSMIIQRDLDNLLVEKISHHIKHFEEKIPKMLSLYDVKRIY